jgi:copper resistance protein B
MAQTAENGGASFEGGFDLAEVRISKGEESFLWESAWSYGDDQDRILLKLDGGGQLGNRIDEIVSQLLYARSVGSSTTIVAGIRHDFQPHPHDTYAVAGFESNLTDSLLFEANLFLSDKGRLFGELKAIYALDLAPSLVLEPRVQLNWAAQDFARDALASGATDAEASARLRYSLTEAAGVYVGVAHERLLGGTADIARAAGEDTRATNLIVGVSFSL